MIQPGILDLVNKYRESSLKKKDVLREILQQSALLGLARHNFFEHAAFYGGTALRILYGLDRFSEDLDFALLKTQRNFGLEPYLKAIESELNGMSASLSAGVVKASRMPPSRHSLKPVPGSIYSRS